MNIYKMIFRDGKILYLHTNDKIDLLQKEWEAKPLVKISLLATPPKQKPYFNDEYFFKPSEILEYWKFAEVTTKKKMLEEILENSGKTLSGNISFFCHQYF